MDEGLAGGPAGPATWYDLAHFPDPGQSASDRVFELARAVAEDVSKDERLNEPVRISLAFGYASYPEDGSGEEELVEKSREPRIRMV